MARAATVIDELQVDPALRTPVPTVTDALRRADAAAAAASVLAPSAEVFAAVTTLLPGRLSDTGLVDALAACDRLRAAVDAVQVQLLAEAARRDPDGEAFLTDEVACALHLAPATAQGRLDQAGQLTTRLWDTFELLRDGRLSAVHARRWPTPANTCPMR
jgi:hypothetical protein